METGREKIRKTDEWKNDAYETRKLYLRLHHINHEKEGETIMANG